MKHSTIRWLAALAAVSLAFLASGASAQDARSNAGEPTVAQIYQAANSGNLDRADAMIDRVLKAHPTSAKAHYVKAELAAREGKSALARKELDTADKLEPGLPFAKADSVQQLRNQLSASNSDSTTATTPSRTQRMGAAADGNVYRTSAPQRSFPWGTLAIVAAIVLVGIAVLRRRSAAVGAGYGGASGNTSAAPYGQTGYGPVYPPNAGGPYPQQPSWGSSMARGVGTGLAMGAGMVAAEEIGRRMFDHGDPRAGAIDPNANANANANANGPTLDQIDDGMRRNLNSDMGGADFGVNDGGGWDDAGGGADLGDFGTGGDWDT